MKKLMLLWVIVMLMNSLPAKSQNDPGETDTIKYPILIEGGKKKVYKLSRGKGGEAYLDTITFTKGQLYERDSANHSLRQFRLSYPEWKTIRCVIALDMKDHDREKRLIGLIEKNGKLRISYKNKKVYLTQVGATDHKDDDWAWTFRNKSLVINISARLDNRQMLRHIRGNGKLIIKEADQTVEEPVYLIYEISDR